MSRRFVLVLTVGLVISTLSFPGGAVGVDQSQTKSGLAIQMTPEQQQTYQSQFDDLQSEFGVKGRANIFWLRSSDVNWVVFTDKEPQPGEATVEGRVLTPEMLGGSDMGVIIADSVSVNQTGTPVDLGELRENPTSYDGGVVRVTAPYRQLAVAVESGSDLPVRQTASGAFGESGFDIQSPSELARWATFNVSMADSENEAYESRLGERPKVVGVGSTQWWMNAKTTVDIGVVVQNGEPTYYLVQSDIVSTDLSGPDELQERGSDLVGDVVSFEVSALGSTISSQEAILSVSQCAPMSATNPVTGCMPIPTDSTLHTGVLFEGNPDTKEDVVPYVGISNDHQQSVIVDERGTYRVTGRVIEASQLHGSLESSYGLVVYDMDRTGDVQVSNTASAKISAWRNETQDAFMRDIQSGAESGDDSGSNSAESRSTTSSTENPSRESEQTRQTTTSSTEADDDSLGIASILTSNPVVMVGLGFGAAVSWISVLVIEVMRGIKSARGHEVQTSDRVIEALFGSGTVLLVLTWLAGGPDLLLFVGVVVILSVSLGWLGKWVYREI